mmetsp:Transcript_7087/g.23284  ORF Transcript_7087/g.23284 Transcript_7087/m.23284 type:complete len:370 (-) Transcript_7087:170-1279(-)
MNRSPVGAAAAAARVEREAAASSSLTVCRQPQNREASSAISVIDSRATSRRTAVDAASALTRSHPSSASPSSGGSAAQCESATCSRVEAGVLLVRSSASRGRASVRKPSAAPRKEPPLRALPKRSTTPSSCRRASEVRRVAQAARVVATSAATAARLASNRTMYARHSSRFCSRGMEPTSSTNRSANPSEAGGTPALTTMSSSSGDGTHDSSAATASDGSVSLSKESTAARISSNGSRTRDRMIAMLLARLASRSTSAPPPAAGAAARPTPATGLAGPAAGWTEKSSVRRDASTSTGGSDRTASHTVPRILFFGSLVHAKGLSLDCLALGCCGGGGGGGEGDLRQAGEGAGGGGGGDEGVIGGGPVSAN